MSKPSLTIQRKIKANPEKVFQAWTQPEALSQWFGPGAIQVVSAESDPTPGGRYRIQMKSPDGEMHDVGGAYQTVEPFTALSFTWAWASTPERESFVALTFEAMPYGTLLTVKHDQFYDEEARDRHDEGWLGSLEKLEAYVSKRAA